MSDRWVYFFEQGEVEGGRELKELLGGKGANLAEMTSIGVPVPPGFTISTRACVHYMEHGTLPEGVVEEVERDIPRLEEAAGKRFGATDSIPLLVSVRSGAAVSMPGMMDTILNLGLNDDTVRALAEEADERFAFDSYRRFIQMYGDVVLGIDHQAFEERLTGRRTAAGVQEDTELSADDLKQLVRDYKSLVEERTGEPFPADPRDQLWGAVKAVFRSWDNERAIAYRRHHRIPDTMGTAVTVQTMVYGNMGDDSGTGVAFTRNPSTGEDRVFGEFLLNAQGEDVVSGIRTPVSISEMETLMPGAYEELYDIQEKLEHHYRDMQDLEFTVERGRSTSSRPGRASGRRRRPSRSRWTWWTAA
jgi:pyruvate, orthophosphate dikinase